MIYIHDIYIKIYIHDITYKNKNIDNRRRMLICIVVIVFISDLKGIS